MHGGDEADVWVVVAESVQGHGEVEQLLPAAAALLGRVVRTAARRTQHRRQARQTVDYVDRAVKIVRPRL